MIGLSLSRNIVKFFIQRKVFNKSCNLIGSARERNFPGVHLVPSSSSVIVKVESGNSHISLPSTLNQGKLISVHY